MKTTTILPFLALFSGHALAQSQPECDTPDADEIPVDNDCADFIHNYQEGSLSDLVSLTKDVWTVTACSETCKIAVKADSDTQVQNYNIMMRAIDVIHECGKSAGGDDYASTVPFKGQASAWAPEDKTPFVVSVYKARDGGC